MQRSIQHEPLLVQQLKTSQWAFPIHTHNHFELIMTLSGGGHHIINGNQFPYQSGDVFFLGPLDNHYFTIDEDTRFYCLSFTEQYLAGLIKDGICPWQQLCEQSLHKGHQVTGSIVTDRREQKNLFALVEIILAEQTNNSRLTSNPIVESIIRTILSLLDRQLTQCQPMPSVLKTAPSILTQRIVTYICHHIAEPNDLRMENLAEVFNYSQSHLSALFKQHIGESIQQYIIRYKLRLVETGLTLSAKTISQIADELGFTDVCHLNKLFKRYYQRTPTDYRRACQMSREPIFSLTKRRERWQFVGS